MYCKVKVSEFILKLKRKKIFTLVKANYRCFLLVFLVLLLCGCGTTVECIDPDDWGGDLTTTVSSSPSNPKPKPVDSAKPYGDQYVEWTDGFQLTGKKIVMIIRNTFNQTHANLQCANPNNFTTAQSSWRFLLADNSPGNANSPFKCNNNSCPATPLCIFANANNKNWLPPNYPWYPPNSDMATDDLPDTNVPCVLNMGLGLYSQIMSYSGSDPGKPPARTMNCNISDGNAQNCVLHIGDNACQNTMPWTSNNSYSNCNSPFMSQGCPAGGAAFMPPDHCQKEGNKCFIFFKILDRYYSDNYGQYTIDFKSGVQKNGSPGIITTFIGMVQGVLCNAAESDFKNLIKEQSYLGYIRLILVLYVIFLGLGYLAGFIDFSHKELIVRVFKMAIVIQLVTTESSWSFFSDYFFKFFTNGVGEITGIIFNDPISSTKISIPGIQESSSCQFQNLSGFASFDKILKELVSYQTSRKIMSLLVWKGGGYVGGALLVVIIYCLIGVVLFIMLKSIMIYIVSYLVISLLIILSPIFIPFILFQVTRSWFDGWLKNLISYFIQPIVILTFAFFLLQIFMNQMHYLFGYRVCFKEWFNFIGHDPLNIKVFAWQYDFANPEKKQCIFTPNELLEPSKSGTVDIKTNNKNNTNNEPHRISSSEASFKVAQWPGPDGCTPYKNYYCQGNCPPPTTNCHGADCPKPPSSPHHPTYCDAYACTQMRYADYPYLNPLIASDQSRIQELQKSDPQLISLKDIGILVLIIWFMWQFNNVVPKIAKKLSGNAMSFTSGSALAGSLLRWGGRATLGILNQGYKRAFKGRDLSMDLKLAGKRINAHRDNFARMATGDEHWYAEQRSKIKSDKGRAVFDALSAGRSMIHGAVSGSATSFLSPKKLASKAVGGAYNLTGKAARKVKPLRKILEAKDKVVDTVTGVKDKAKEKLKEQKEKMTWRKERAQDYVADKFKSGLQTASDTKRKLIGGAKQKAKSAVRKAASQAWQGLKMSFKRKGTGNGQISSGLVGAPQFGMQPQAGGGQFQQPQWGGVAPQQGQGAAYAQQQPSLAPPPPQQGVPQQYMQHGYAGPQAQPSAHLQQPQWGAQPSGASVPRAEWGSAPPQTDMPAAQDARGVPQPQRGAPAARESAAPTQQQSASHEQGHSSPSAQDHYQQPHHGWVPPPSLVVEEDMLPRGNRTPVTKPDSRK